MSSKMRSEDYHEGYWERAEGSNYRNYGDDPGWTVTARIIADQVLKMEIDGRVMDVGASVLEVACAKGYFVLAARNWGIDCYGMDISEYAINSAPRIIRPYLSVGNAFNLDDLVYAYPLGNPNESESQSLGALEAVVSNEFLEHVYEDEIDQVLDNMVKMVKPGGWLFNRIGLDMETGEDYAHQDDDCTHVLVRPRSFWEKKFADRGLIKRADVEKEFDFAFRGRDWQGRFFVYQTPGHTYTHPTPLR